MKIAMLIYWGDKAGVYTHVKNISSRITKHSDIELHILALSEKNCTGELFGGTAHFLKRARFRGANYFYNPFLIKSKILEINPDLVHIHTTIISHAIAAMMLPKKYPIIVTVHQNIEDDIKSRLSSSSKRHIKLKIEPYLEKMMLKRAQHVIIPSPHLREYFSTIQNKVNVIPNGVNLEEIQGYHQMYENIRHPSLFFVGRLEKVKGVDILIKALSKVKVTIPNIHLYIAGSGDEENKLKELEKRLNIQNNITFLGFISGYKKWSYYKYTDLFILPSLYDTAPVALVEAMACGKPIIASNTGGIPSVVEDAKNGLLFECCNVDDLADKITFLLQNNELQEKMGKIGREKAKEFSWDRITASTLNLYREIFNISNNCF